MKPAKYKGPWNKQCPYCLSRKVLQEVYVCVDAGVPHREWADSAECLKCGKAWEDYEVQVPGCIVCGANHSGDIGDDETTYRRADGTIHNDPLMICHNCGTLTDQTTGEVIRRGYSQHEHHRTVIP